MILALPFRHESWRVTPRRGSMIMSQRWVRRASMLSQRPLMAAFSDAEKTGAISPVSEVLPGVYRGMLITIG